MIFFFFMKFRNTYLSEKRYELRFSKKRKEKTEPRVQWESVTNRNQKEAEDFLPPFSSLSSEALDFVVLPTHGTDTQVRGGVKHWPVFGSVRRRRWTRGDPTTETRGEL